MQDIITHKNSIIIASRFGKTIPCNDLQAVRSMLVSANSSFMNIDTVGTASWDSFGSEGKISDVPFTSPITNFYMTDPISRASETMAKCTDTFAGAQDRMTGTHG